MADLVEPEDDTPDSEAFRDELLRKNLPPRFADAVASWFFGTQAIPWWPNVQPEPRPEDLDGQSRFDNLVHWAGDAFKEGQNEAVALLRFVSAVVDWGVLRNGSGRRLRAKGAFDPSTGERLAIANALLPRVLALGVNIAEALRSAASSKVEIRARPIIEIAAIRIGALHPRDTLDMVPLRAWDRWSRPPEPGNNDTASVMYWLMEHGARGFLKLEEVIFAEPDDTVGRVASGVLANLEFGLVEPSFGDPVQCRDGTPIGPVALRLATWTDHLVERAAKREGDVYLLSAVFESTEIVYRLTRQDVPTAVAAKVAKLAGRALGLLRRRAREDGPSCALVDTQTGRWAYGQALVALATTEGLGSALTSGTLVLRSLQEAAVGPDLRPWHDPPLPNPPERWSWLPNSLLGLIHNIGSVEQHDDPHLVDARSTFALFLLDRLKPEKGSSAAPREPNSTWRRCCIRALRELAVNPDGHGHRILHKVIDNDPDPQVRLAAQSAYEELRRADGTTGSVSPRRRLMAATWWMRQAHWLALGGEVDSSGARRTRNREISRTREKKEVPKST